MPEMRRRGVRGNGHRLLLARFQVTGRVSTRAQPLHGIEHVLLLGKEGIAQITRPIEFVIHHLERLRNRRQGLDARIPRLLLHRVIERLTVDCGIGLRPARSLDNLQRISRSHQDLRKQGIGIKGDRRHQLLELRRRPRAAVQHSALSLRRWLTRQR